MNIGDYVDIQQLATQVEDEVLREGLTLAWVVGLGSDAAPADTGAALISHQHQ